MSTLQRRARAALAARLAASLAPAALHFSGEHTLELADALVPTLDVKDIAWARAELERGAKGELRPTRSGTVGAHAAWSSTALVCSAFAPWRATPGALRLAGLTGFEAVRLEERLLIPHGGGTPNLDVALPHPTGLVGVESKLTEHLSPRRPRAWPPAYRREAMAAAFDGGWARVFAALLNGSWAPRFLDAGQLVRHALSLQVVPEARLVLLFWEPGGSHPEVDAHRSELAELVSRLGEDAQPRFHALTWSAVLAEWAPAQPDHVRALRERYEVSVVPEGSDDAPGPGRPARHA